MTGKSGFPFSLLPLPLAIKRYSHHLMWHFFWVIYQTPKFQISIFTLISVLAGNLDFRYSPIYGWEKQLEFYRRVFHA